MKQEKLMKKKKKNYEKANKIMYMSQSHFIPATLYTSHFKHEEQRGQMIFEQRGNLGSYKASIKPNL